MNPFRIYAPDECGADGYPRVWHRGLRYYRDGDTWIVEPLDSPRSVGVKDLVRSQAEHRCVRCGHPYMKGAGEWSSCDSRCRHGGPVRFNGEEYDEPMGDLAVATTVFYGTPVVARWRILTVHHLRTGLDGKRDLRWWNLAALCQRCHLAIQGKVVMEQVWPHEHSEWFKPYAAGWYAWAYLGENLTREETMVRLDELLLLEQVSS